MNPVVESQGTGQQGHQHNNVAAPTVVPRIDILETKDEVQLLVDLPGVEPAGVQLEVYEGELQLIAIPANTDRPEAKSLLHEAKQVQYKRHLKLADSLDHEKVWAEQALGVLRIHLPKKAEIQKRKIEVRQA
ncbi:MAG: Hsp20/alpha crystallin family protein [Gemmataceae bacterium]|nr:Hsp20/alpha crystallin family protein [Gemmataceae bacterium]